MTAIDPSIACVLLAAGSARRFGGGKLLATLGGLPLWEWAAEKFEQAGFQHRYVVVQPSDTNGPARSGWKAVHNHSAQEGIASSIRAGVEAASGHARIVIGLADMPFAEPDHLSALARGNGPIFTLFPDGRAGCPAGFSAEVFPHLMLLQGDRGAAALYASLQGASLRAPPTSTTTFDIDDEANLARAEQMIRNDPSLVPKQVTATLPEN
tara:strand:+ start:813 stop:1442 length:630 start_codon:yes stop_codon:yes gene_type:complete